MNQTNFSIFYTSHLYIFHFFTPPKIFDTHIFFKSLTPCIFTITLQIFSEFDKYHLDTSLQIFDNFDPLQFLFWISYNFSILIAYQYYFNPC